MRSASIGSLNMETVGESAQFTAQFTQSHNCFLEFLCAALIVVAGLLDALHGLEHLLHALQLLLAGSVDLYGSLGGARDAVGQRYHGIAGLLGVALAIGDYLAAVLGFHGSGCGGFDNLIQPAAPVAGRLFRL